MKNKTLKKVISIMLCIGMTFTVMYAPSGLAYADETTSGEGTVTITEWTPLDDIEKAAESEVPVAITMTKDDATWILPAQETTKAPLADNAAVADNKLTADGDKAAYGWTITKTEGTYSIVNSEGKYLYLTDTNNGVRIGDVPETGKAAWAITSDYLTAAISDTVTRYLGVYNKQDWRCYTSINNNITGQTLQFWALESEKEVAPPEVVISQIKDVLQGETGTEFTVKGVITMIDGKNVYVQDETGGICLFLSETSADIKLGDTVTGTGKYTVYKGLPELSPATLEISEGMTLTPKETTIGALTTADVCTYVKIKDLTVESISGDNTTVKDAEGKTINIYKAVLGDKTLAAGDQLDFTGAVGIFNTTLQLRNTSADEITVKEAPQGPFTVTVEAAENGRVDVSKTADIASGEEVTITVAPAEGYILDTLLVNGEETAVGEDGTATVTITKDTTVKATFKEKTPEVTVNTIAEALAGEANAEFTVKGVVTLVDGRNIYVQDETGGICLYFATAPSDIALGDTIVGNGKRATYKGLPELSNGTYEKAEGLTLTAKETTIGALTAADVCTYVELKDVTVTEVYDNNGAYSSPNITLKDADGNTIQIYKAAVGKTDGAWDVKVDDVVTVKAAVGINNTNLQLRNTSADEITVKEAPVPQGPFTLTIEEAENGTVEASKTADIEAGEEVTITVTPAEGYVLDKLLVNDEEVAVGEDGTAKITITKDTAVKATFKEEGSVPATESWAKLTEAPFDGAQVVIFYPASNQVMTSTASGNKLAGTAATPVEDQIEITEEMAKLDVTCDDGVYTFKNAEGKYLTSGETGNSISFQEDGTSDLAKWTLTKQDDGTWYVMNVGAAYNGNHNQALEYYNGFTTYGVKDNNSAYKFEFYGIQGIEKLSLITTVPQDGANLVIYHPTSATAMTSTASGAKLQGTAAIVNNGKLEVSEEMARLDVSMADGVYTFKNAEGKYLTSGETGNSISFQEDGTSDLAKWTLTKQDDGTWYVMNVGAAYNGKHNQALEYYNGYTTYGVKDNNNAYKFEFYGTTPDEPVEPPAGDSFGLTSTIADGDEVILYNANNGKAVGNTISSNKVAGVTVTPEDGVITTADTSVVWTVKVNEDGTYKFTQGDYTLGGKVVTSGDKTYNNLVLSEAEYTDWTLTGPDSSDFSYFLKFNNWSSSYGNFHLEYFNGFTVYASSSPTKDAYGINFYKKGAEAETPVGEIGDLVTGLDQLTDGQTVAIYSPSHKTAISSKANGDWYLKANSATIEDGKVANFTSDFIWKVKVNDDGTYSFYSYDKEDDSISVWPSGNYAELTVNTSYNTETVNKWVLSPFSSENHTWYIKSSSLTFKKTSQNVEHDLPAYIEAYVRNGTEVFSGYAPFENQLTNTDYALQFYLVDPEEAVAAYDDGEWDGVLNKGDQYVIYNASAEASLGLYKEANYAFDAIPTTIEDGLAEPGNGAYVFTVDSMGRYYTFSVGGKFLATNNAEELLFVDPKEDGTAPEEAKWFLTKKEGKDASNNDISGYIIYNKTCQYGGTPVCIEYFSSVFSGWTFSTKNDLGIYLFDFYKVTDDTKIYEGVVQVPSAVIDCPDVRYVEQDFKGSFTLFDLAPEVSKLDITYTVGDNTEAVPIGSFTGAGGTFEIPAEYLDKNGIIESFDVTVSAKNSYDLEYSTTKTITVLDEPFITDLTPDPNSQTGEDKRPVISAKIGNVGEAPTFKMTVNGQEVEAKYEDGVLSYQSTEDMADGRTEVVVSVTRADGKTAEKQWSFTVGFSDYQMYFGQLHSHTTYSDGSGTLETALEYVESLPESANVQFVAFTDHSNYFDTTSAANPADSLNDKSLMTEASRAEWEGYKAKIAAFNEKQSDIVAIGGFEMTWSGGPGHINTFDSDGLVSRNNAELNNKTNDAGMKLYYETINKGESLNQFNHPGTTFGNFTDFSYWNEETDEHMFLVEVGNGEGQIGAGGYYPSYEEYFLALDKGWHVAPTNNQDNHKGRWGNANDARDVILANDFSEQGIYDAIRNLRVYATEDKNLHIGYTVNGEPMGTVFSETPESLLININLYDPDESDEIQKVEIIADGGKTIYTWDDQELLKGGDLSREFSPNYTYYLVRVTQKDGDIAVTAPVWTGMSTKVGITGLKAASEEVYKGEETKLVTTFFNNEDKDATVKSLTYTINGSEVIGTDTKGYTLKANGTLDTEFATTFDKAKLTTVTVTAVVEYGGQELTYTAKAELDVLDRETEGKVTPIADVIKASVPDDTGYRFTIEGVLTSNASGYDKDTAFFDCVYVQDESAGICIFPVSGDYKEGDKVRVVGHTDFYQGEPELQVKSIEVIGSGSVAPMEVTSAQINDRSVEGSLVSLTGTVESFEEANGLIQTIMVKDAEGNVARVFIDGYITTGNEVKNCEAGAEITAVGLASYDDTFNAPEGPFPRIRIRNRADIICKAKEKPQHTHSYGEYKLTRKATLTHTGILTKSCKCGKKITMVVGPTVAKAGCIGASKAKLSWNKVKGAQRYQVYFVNCGQDKLKKIATTTDLSYIKKNLVKAKGYKFKVVAQRKIDGKWKTISSSYTAHFVSGDLTRNGKYTNTRSIKVNMDSVTLKAGKSRTIKAEAVGVKKGKRIFGKTHTSSLRYLSSNTDIASVDKTGKITAKAAGTCKIYVIGVNGVWKTVKVTVK